MILPAETFRYEIRRGGELIAIEEESFAGAKIIGTRRPPAGSDRYEVEAEIDSNAVVSKIVLRYSRGPFVRSASYEGGEDFLRGNVSALAGRNVVTTKLGRYREVDAELQIFRALTIAHIRARGQTRWTGRVATIDSSTLVASTNKQSCRCAGDGVSKWIYEPRMGDAEEIEIDAEGRLLVRRDNRGIEARLVR